MEDKTIVYKVQIDYSDLTKNQVDIAAKIKSLQQEQLNLDGATEKNRKAFRENAAQLKLLEQQQKLNSKALTELTAEEKKNTDSTNFNNNSIKQNRELLKQLNAEYIRIQNPTKEQTANLLKLTNTLKAQEAAIGNNTRNVGNYAESFQGVISQFPALSSGLNGVKVGFQAISTANPFGLIALALGPIIQSFLKLEPVANTLGGIFEGISATFTTIASAAKDFFDAISSGQGLISSFTSAFDGLGGKISQAAASGYELVQALDDLEDAERANQAAQAETEKQVDILIAQSKDRTKTEKERVAILNEANRLEEAQLAKDLQIANQRVAIQAKEAANAIRLGKDRDTAEQNLQNALSARSEIERRSIAQTEKNQGRINQLIEAEANARASAEEKRLALEEKKKAQEEKAEADRIKKIEQAKKFFEDTTKAELEFSLNALDIYYKQQENLLKTQLANNLIAQEEFDKQSQELQVQKLESELIVLQDYQANVTGLEQQAAAKSVEIDTAKTDIILANKKKESDATAKAKEKEKQQRIKELQDLKAFTEQVSANYFATLTAQGDFSKNFAKANALLFLDILEKQVIASTLVQSLSSPESIATFGAAGVIKAAIITAAIKTAFGIARGGIAGFADGGLVDSVEGFANGGLTGTKVFNSFGKPISRANGDNRLVTVKTGEVILNKKQQQRLGGARTFKNIGVKGFASGGVVPTNVDTSFTDAINGQQFVVSVTEVADVMNRLKAIETLGTI